MTNFKAALVALGDARVNFIVVGAYAGVLQGSAQVTQDIDICYERNPENMRRLVAALSNGRALVQNLHRLSGELGQHIFNEQKRRP
jgi:hypothetical protein